jgi:hypothetical protein
MQTQVRNNNEPGGTVDSWCGKCKMMLAHTIEAMVGNKPARVQCNTCKAQHAYKASEPGKPSGNGARGSRAPANRYKSLLKGSDSATAKKYSPKDRYEPGDVLEHGSFGRGVATATKGENKIEVLFESGSKLLVHGWS